MLNYVILFLAHHTCLMEKGLILFHLEFRKQVLSGSFKQTTYLKCLNITAIMFVLSSSDMALRALHCTVRGLVVITQLCAGVNLHYILYCPEM